MRKRWRERCARGEFDPSGRRTAYYFYKQHPGERIFFPTGLELMRVPVAPARPVAGRAVDGERAGAPIAELDQYDDADLPRKKFAAMMMGFITRQNPDDAFFPNAAPEEATGAGGALGASNGPRANCHFPAGP